MAPSPDALTEAHRLAQTRLGVGVVTDMRTLWPLLDVNDLDGTFGRWLRATTPLIQARRATSASLAAHYLTTYRALVLGVDVPAPAVILAEQVAPAQLATSLLVTGPISIKQNIARAVDRGHAGAVGEANSARAAMRHAMNGGRETIARMTAADRRSTGRYRRVTSGNPCKFCKMLASRGAVYRAATARFHAHDGCSCSAQPEYRR